MQDLDFAVKRGDVFVVMGGSGSGKSTLLRHLLGLLEPARGEIFYDGVNFTAAAPEERARMLRRCGVCFQAGGLWSSLTWRRTWPCPSRVHRARADDVAELTRLKLALVGLRGFEDYYPSELSGGMQKRAGLARAIALDPEILFFDEPSAGLDPVSARLLDQLILELRDSLGATVVVVTHELDSIFTIASNSIFLDTESRGIVASGDPHVLKTEASHPAVRRFLNRGTDPREGRT